MTSIYQDIEALLVCLPVNPRKELFKIDRDSKLPLYDQIERNLRALIINGALKPGEAVPSEWELAELYGVSRLTVRRSLDELVRQQWLSKRHGVGTFVTRPSIATIAPSKLSFTQQMQAIGRAPSSRLICQEIIPANHEIASALALSEGDPVVKITRLRLADEVPILLETSYLSKKRFPELEKAAELESGSLYEALSTNYGVYVSGMEQTLKPVLLTEDQAQILETLPGSPSICSDIVAFSSDGEPIEVSWSVANGEHCEFYFSFQRGEIRE